MPRFTGQNKKRIDPRYFLNETMDPEVALSALGALKIGSQVPLKNGREAEIVDIIGGGNYDVVIYGNEVDLERYVKDSEGGHSQSEYGVPMSSVESVDGGKIEVGVDVMYDGELYQVKDVHEDEEAQITIMDIDMTRLRALGDLR